MLKATKRKPGTRQAKKLRLQGLIPASIQGEGRPNADVSIEERAFMTARRHHEHLFEIEVEGGDTETVLVHQLQWETTVERIQHVEFRRVVLGRKTEVEVELVFTGHPKGGVTNHLVTHITILALPSEIPDAIEVPMGDHEPGHTVHASDLVLPVGVELAVDADLVIANVAVPRNIEDETPEEETEPVVETKATKAPEADE
jgi:large subunit ribosomal protein L25